MYKIFLLVLLLASSCGTSKSNTTNNASEASTETATELQEGQVTLALDEQKQLGDVFIHFKEVLEDSRCPTATNCFWQGRAKLLVEMSDDGMTVTQAEIIFGELKPGESKNHRLYSNGGTIITATAINPYPTAETGTTGLQYQLVLEVSKE